jgi:hypothetical protein
MAISLSHNTHTTPTWRLWLANPFHFLAGGQALAWGLALIALTAWVGSTNDYRFTGVLSFQRSAPVPLWHSFLQGLIGWAILSGLLYAGGRLISRSHVRLIDVFGTQALARAPGLLIALIVLLPPFPDLTADLVAQSGFHLSIPEIVLISFLGLTLVLVLVWMVLLFYRAFAVSCNVGGSRAIAVFIAVLLLAEVAAGAAGAATLLLPGAAASTAYNGVSRQRRQPVRTTTPSFTASHPNPSSPRTGSF